jgi:hypothetical protein
MAYHLPEHASPRFDFTTCNNAETQHVKVYHVDSGDTVAVFPIHNGDVSEAEEFARIFLEALQANPGAIPLGHPSRPW